MPSINLDCKVLEGKGWGPCNTTFSGYSILFYTDTTYVLQNCLLTCKLSNKYVPCLSLFLTKCLPTLVLVFIMRTWSKLNLLLIF